MKETTISQSGTFTQPAQKDSHASIEIFRDLTEDQRSIFDTIFKYQFFKERTTIYSEGDKDSSLYIIKDGKVSVSFYLDVNTGNIRPIVQTVYKNGMLGELEFIDQRPRTSTAIAEKDSILIKIDREAFWEIINKNTDIAFIVMKNFNRILTSRFRRSNRQLKTALTMGWNAYKFNKY